MRIKTPLSDREVTGLSVGDSIRLSGTVVTARDMAHKYLVEHSPGDLPFSLEGMALYHCGPIVRDIEVVAAGPTTSAREEPYEADVIQRYGVKAVIGKGGMGEKTLKSLREHKAVYLSAVGGAAALLAESIKSVRDVHMLEEFGAPEAFWIFEVKDMPLIVSMDAHGKSIHGRVEVESKSMLEKMLSED